MLISPVTCSLWFIANGGISSSDGFRRSFEQYLIFDLLLEDSNKPSAAIPHLDGPTDASSKANPCSTAYFIVQPVSFWNLFWAVCILDCSDEQNILLVFRFGCKKSSDPRFITSPWLDVTLLFVLILPNFCWKALLCMRLDCWLEEESSMTCTSWDYLCRDVIMPWC